MAIAEVIKYEGDNSTFIWKHPSEDFNSLTQLIVHESQEAIFYMKSISLSALGIHFTASAERLLTKMSFIFVRIAPGMKSSLVWSAFAFMRKTLKLHRPSSNMI